MPEPGSKRPANYATEPILPGSESNRQLPVNECLGTFVIPDPILRCMESPDITPIGHRPIFRVVPENPPAPGMFRQGTEQIHIVFAAEEHDRFFVPIREHADVTVSLAPRPLVVIFGVGAESNIVVRCQEICTDQSPAGRKDVQVLYTDMSFQSPIDRIFI